MNCFPAKYRPIHLLWLLAWFLMPPVPAPAAPRELFTHLPNGGFEQTTGNEAVGWKPFEQGYTLDLTTHHGGTRSLRCVSNGTTDSHGAACFQILNQAVPTPIVVSGWSRAQNVGGSADDDYAVYVDLTYTDGTALWGQTAPFETGTHGWQRRHLMIFPAKPLRSMIVYALFRHHPGTAWFDDFDAHELGGNGVFDSQSLAVPALPPGASGGWFARDVAADSPPFPLPAGRPSHGLRLDAPAKQAGGKIVRAVLHNLTGQARAVTVYYVERFTAPNETWWNDISERLPVRAGHEYANLTHISVGATGQMSLYPFGCVTGGGKGLALGVPPEIEPRVARLVFNPSARLLFVAYDVALTGRGDPAGHDRTEVAVARYTVDPDWGFRDAAAKFYALFPEAFRRRARPEGIWMPFTDPGTIPNVQDFHVAYHEGDNSVAGDRGRGILSFRYVEPMTYWMPMAPSLPRTYADALALVRQLAAGKDETARRQAQAVLTSGSQDAQGHFNVSFRDTPWANGGVWVLNPNPRLPHPPGEWTKAQLNALGEPTPGAADQPDGEYLDSLEGWADVLDYRPESLRYTTTTLTFTPDTFRPVLPTWFSVYEDAAALSRDLHRHGKLLMANSTPWRFPEFAPLLDVMGTETNWFPDGQWQPDSDAIFDLRRTACYHKPYLLLMNTDFTKIGSPQVERYFQRCLFYGVFPSMFSVDAADHPYWENKDWYERDRPLFQTYIPLIQRLSQAGWEPVTYARASHPSVRLERYGTQYLTVLNTTDTPCDVTISVDAAHLWPNAVQKRGAGLIVSDLRTGQVITQAPLRSIIPLRLTLQGGETRILSCKFDKRN